MKKIMLLLKDENGEIMLESTIIFTIVLFVLIAMLSLGFMFYQQAALGSLTTEIAQDIGANYKLSSTTDKGSYNSQNLYRTTFNLAKAKEYHTKRAAEMFEEKYRIVTLGINSSAPEIKIDIVNDNVGRLHAEVSVSVECSIFLDGALKFFKIIDSTLNFTANTRAECLDITSYAGQVQFLNYVTNKLDGEDSPVSNITNIIEQIVRIVKNGEGIKEVFTGGN